MAQKEVMAGPIPSMHDGFKRGSIPEEGDCADLPPDKEELEGMKKRAKNYFSKKLAIAPRQSATTSAVAMPRARRRKHGRKRETR